MLRRQRQETPSLSIAIDVRRNQHARMSTHSGTISIPFNNPKMSISAGTRQRFRRGDNFCRTDLDGPDPTVFPQTNGPGHLDRKGNNSFHNGIRERKSPFSSRSLIGHSTAIQSEKGLNPHPTAIDKNGTLRHPTSRILA